MRTTGIRSVPIPTPRTQVGAGGPPQPLPRTKFYTSTAPTVNPPHQPAFPKQHVAHSSNKDKNVTLKVIYEHSPPLKQDERAEVSQPSKSKNEDESDLSAQTSINTSELATSRSSAPRTPARCAPPKPPRTFNHQVNPTQDTTHRNKITVISNRKIPDLPKSTPIPSRPKLIDILYRPSPSQKAVCDSKFTVPRNSNSDPSQAETTVSLLSTEREGALGNVRNQVAPASLTSKDGQVYATTLRAAAGKTRTSQSSITECGGGRGATQINSSQGVDTRLPKHRVPNNRNVPFPPPPSVPPPSVPSTATSSPIVQPGMSSRPEVPARPTVAQVAAIQKRKKDGWPKNWMSDPLRISSRSRGTSIGPASTARAVDQDPVYTPEDFEDNCKEVFKCIKVAKDHMIKGRYFQAASVFQAALTAIDRVLKAQVLSIVNDEHTRQRFFHLQQEVFIARKETLNGFSDAQAAARPIGEVSTSAQAPGAPPSYDDVLREDLSLSRDESSGAPSRLPSQPEPAAVGQRTVQGNRGRLRRSARSLTVDVTSRPGPPLLPQPARSSCATSSSLQTRQAGVEVLVDTSADPPHPPPSSHTAPVNLTFQPLVPTQVSPPRPKSIIPSLEKPIPETSPRQPEDTTSCPGSSHTPTKTPVPKPRTSSKTSEPPVVESGSPPPLDEAIFYQAQAIKKIEEQRKTEGSMAAVVAATAEPTVNEVAAENSSPSLEIPSRSYLITGSNWSQLDNSPKINVKDCRVVEDGGDKTLPSGEAAASAQRAPGSITSQSFTSHSFSISDPFTNTDPFSQVDTNTIKSDSVFSDDYQSPSMLVFNNINSVSKTDTCKVPVTTPADAGVLRPSGEAGFEGYATPLGVKQVNRTCTGSPQDDRGTPVLAGGSSILEALDVAICRTPSHRKVTPQNSKGSIHSRSYSQDTLLDCSYGALNNYIESSKGICASRASIIEEFDPLLSSSYDNKSPVVSADHKKNKIRHVETHVKETEVDVVTEHRVYENSEVFLPERFSEEGAMAAAADLYYSTRGGGVPYDLNEKTGLRGLPADIPCNSTGVGGLPFDPLYNNTGVRDLSGDPPCHNTGIQDVSANLYDSKGPSPDSPNAIGTRSSVSSSTGSCVSWPPERVKNASWSPQPLTPPSADTSGDDSTRMPWSSETGEPQETGVGRSAFYRPLATQKVCVDGRGENRGGTGSEAGLRDLLKITEGVKIFFIYTDGVVTSPWNKPFLAASKDTSMAWYVGEGVVLRVGSKLWSCQLHSKSTLVLRTLSGTYIFKDVAGKHNCQAVGIQVPSKVRKTQHQLLSNILRENTLLEDERPTGLTKAISKGASSAASRVNQFVNDKSRTTNTAFIRQNSIRALRGMSRGLKTLAERTGSTMPELPPEYQELQEAANVLQFSRTAKAVQYI
nr:mucin-5AC-like [Procambarus clarkii]